MNYFIFPATENEDIIDEAMKYFRANIFFRNYDIKVSHIYQLNFYH
jgi:ARP2/3 complex subunit ARPC3